MHIGSSCDHHHHEPANFNAAFAVGIALNASFVILELGAGFYARSLALVADAGHNLGDVLGLAMSWTAAVLAVRPATYRRTYGFRRSTILAALANSLLLMVIVGGIGWESIERLDRPVSVQGSVVMITAFAGILINGGTALMFLRGRNDDLNVRAAYLHMLTDALVAMGVVVTGFAIRLTGLSWLDGAAGFGIAALIGIGTWKMLRTSIDLALDAVPSDIDPKEVRSYLEALPGVDLVADLHIWGMSTTETALTAHLVVPEPWPDERLHEVSHELSHRFGIDHSTIQMEKDHGAGCPLAL